MRMFFGCALAIGAVFALDCYLPLSVAGGVPYVLAVMVSLWSPRKRDIAVVAGLCTLLVWVRYFWPPGDISDLQHAVANRCLATFAIFVTTAVGLRRKHGEHQLEDLTLSLAERVAERTSQREETHQALEDQAARYRSLMESLPINVFQKGMDGNIVFGNKRYYDTLGKTEEEMVGRSDFELFPKELADKYRQDDEQVRTLGVTLEDIEEHVTPDGEKHYVHVLKAPMRDAHDQIVGTQVMFWDVTARVRAEEAQARADARFRCLVESNVIGIITVRFDGTILEANDAFLQMVGYTRDDLKAGNIHGDKMTPPKYRESDERVIEQLKSTGTAEPWEKEYTRKDGTRVPVLLGVTMLPDSEDESICFVLDISAQKHAEVQLRAAKEAADAASAAKSQFLANMSHEVRTPMNAVIGYSDLVLSTNLTKQQREYVNTVRESSEALLAVINDVLDFSKVEAGKLELELTNFSLREVVGDTMKALAVHLQDKELEMICDIQSATPDSLLGDKGRLRQILINLVGNAIKFTETGEVVVHIEVDSQSDEDVSLHFCVTDTGIGIPDHLRTAIFSAFEQADASTTRRFGGTGLGLAIASRLVELMEGRIWFESEVEQGSKFHFTARFQIAQEPQSTEEVIVGGKRVLIVDDNDTNCLMLETMLGNWQMKTQIARSAAEAMDCLKHAEQDGSRFDLILSDVNMPDEDGFSLVKRIKQDGRLDSTIIMMLTSGDRPGDVARCEQLGVTAYLMKPIKQSELFDAIALALGITTAEDSHEETFTEEYPAHLKQLNILLAEDSLVNQKLAVALLENHGHTVVVVSDGKQAVTATQASAFDLVLMDVQMPEMDGLEATRTIRNLERTTGNDLPIIAMTAHAMQGDRERCLAAGMNEYIAKPIRASKLFQTIGKLLGGGASLPEQPIAKAPTSDIVNWSDAMGYVNGDSDLLKDVVAAFLDEAPKLISNVRGSINSQDGPKLHISAHTLKGNMRIFGAHIAIEHAFRLETMGKDNEFESAEESLQTLEVHLARISDELAQFADRRDV